MGEVPAGKRDLKIRDGREMGVGRKERVEEEIQSHRGITKESFSLGDERREGTRGEVESRKANLTFISGILGFAPRRTLSRGGLRARDRVEYEGGGCVCRENVHKLFRILHSSLKAPFPFSFLVQLGNLCSDISFTNSQSKATLIILSMSSNNLSSTYV